VTPPETVLVLKPFEFALRRTVPWALLVPICGCLRR
jgi:hypothetical protein